MESGKRNFQVWSWWGKKPETGDDFLEGLGESICIECPDFARFESGEIARANF
jgi:hypothetical protein